MYKPSNVVNPYNITVQKKGEEEECELSTLENTFKAVNDNRNKNSNVVDKNGLFACSCGRHGSPYIIIDVMKGEGVDEINKRLIQESNANNISPPPIDIMYDICCLTRKSLEKKYSFLQDRGSKFAVNIFHTYAHIWECQINYHPGYTVGWDLTDGEDIVSQLRKDKTGALAESSGFSMNNGTTMWHSWCRANEEVEIFKIIINHYRTHKYNYLQQLESVVNSLEPIDETMRVALALIKESNLPLAKRWRRKTYDAVINDIGLREITVDDEEDQCSDVEEELGIDEEREEEY
ncbi:hypothetical protein INT48_006811 [Thamnidium elegans]|uniref:Uncharacterized protein n=1 Tax=Thamnidium elegans TaxID=101142 RepID=A0A8H7SI14_9FUNG|nr:hypothetical protein INT48_006811 [Thamnidium elegans]